MGHGCGYGIPFTRQRVSLELTTDLGYACNAPSR